MIPELFKGADQLATRVGMHDELDVVFEQLGSDLDEKLKSRGILVTRHDAVERDIVSDRKTEFALKGGFARGLTAEVERIEAALKRGIRERIPFGLVERGREQAKDALGAIISKRGIDGIEQRLAAREDGVGREEGVFFGDGRVVDEKDADCRVVLDLQLTKGECSDVIRSIDDVDDRFVLTEVVDGGAGEEDLVRLVEPTFKSGMRKIRALDSVA